MRRLNPIIVSPRLDRAWALREKRMKAVKVFQDKARECWHLATTYRDKGDEIMYGKWWDRGAKYNTYANGKQQYYDLLWADAVKRVWGETMEVKWKLRKGDYDCVLGNGERYKHG